ncbi:MAG: hypothetical protein IT334_04510, partial [Thermomicrobiales bacterium]|nr:hypothetical protein [Thermomicrobiales bacterium]
MTRDSIRSPRIHTLGWLIAFAGLVLLVIDRFDLLTIWHRVELPDGSVVSVANGWYTVDHPFHISRAHSLLESLRSGELLRWFGEHQGGYPAEFYPTGAAWLDAAIWALTFGLLPVEVVHKLLIALIVLTPAFVFFWWAKRDRRSPGIALLAGAGHVVIAGEWWSGGWTEVVLWGLVTNVAAQTAILGTVAGVHGWLANGRSRDLGWAALFAGLALGINPRTALGLVAIGLAAVIVALMRPNSAGFNIVFRRGLVLVGLSFAAAAPVLISLIRYRDLYYFVHYEEYADLAAWWESSQRALWTPIFWLALAGLVSGLVRANRPLTRTVSLAAAIYMATTAAMVVSGAGIFDQLELTRLMPFQRLLLFFLAAIAVNDIIELAISALRGVGLRSLSPPVLVTDGNGSYVEADSDRTTSLVRNETGGHKVRNPAPGLATPWIGLVMAVFAFALVFNVVLEPAGWVPEEQRGLRPMGSSAQPATVDLQRAVELADATAPEGTAILVLGTVLSWHQGLTAPMWSERRFFYDDWLWYWQRDHV